jgi:predicted class III extradiol MEMO1 family dioxygenase
VNFHEKLIEEVPVKPLLADHHPDCYPSDPAAALDFFRDAFESFSARDIPAAPAAWAKSELLGVVTPHIDFRVSLRAYAAAFRPLLEQPLADTYLILGVGHRSRLEWNLDRRDYVTPLGTAINAVDLVEALTHGAEPERFFSPKAHEGEHSIEFALMWLQALHQLHPDRAQRDRPFRFVPLLCGSLHHYVEGPLEWDELGQFQFLSQRLAKLLDDAPGGQTIRVIVSIDGCHLGPRFDHPFQVTPVLLRVTEGWEKFLWDQVASGEARQFLDWMRNEGNDRYFDGVGALSLLLNAGNLSRRKKLAIQRTFYEQWFTEQDASAVTFSSGSVLG